MPVGPGEHPQELPALLIVGAVGGAFQLLAGPEDGALGPDVEPVGVEHGPLVTQQRHLAVVHDAVDALAGVGTVADDVAQAEDLVDLLSLDVREDHFQSFEIPVNIANEGAAHRKNLRGQSFKALQSPVVVLDATPLHKGQDRGQNFPPFLK